MITAFHGIGAYRGARNPLALKRALDTALSGVEICCADRPIGAFGGVFFGSCSWVFNQDVWSYVDEFDGRRYIGESVGEYSYLETPDQEGFESFCKNDVYYSHADAYCEAWVSPCALRALWVKPWAGESTKKAAELLAKNRKVPLLVLDSNARIWDLLDKKKLPFIV